jgi:hypothetical protein
MSLTQDKMLSLDWHKQADEFYCTLAYDFKYALVIVIDDS